jgi:hypothetical protein
MPQFVGNWPINGDAQARPALDQWLNAHLVAEALVNKGKQQLMTAKPASWNLQCLLSNMCDYGRLYFQYSPGSASSSKSSIEGLLKGGNVITDCENLAKAFCEIAIHLGFKTIQAQKIERTGYRIVTKPGMVTFNGKKGDPSLQGRWCFGDHWVAVYENLCYDPTFNFKGFSLAQAPTVYLGWFAQEMADPKCFAKTYWKADARVPGSRDVYMRMIPDIAYTFSRTNIQGKEVK